MKYYIKEHPFSIKGKFDIYNQFEEALYHCEGEFALTRKLHLYDKLNKEVAFIQAKLFSLHSRHFIEREGFETVEMNKAVTIRPHYYLEKLGWEIEGNFWEHDYTIKCGDKVIASVTKQWFKLVDCYEIDISDADDVDDIYVLCAVLVIDSVLMTQAAAASSAH